MLTEVADGVWVQQSEWVWTNAIVVRGDGGLVLVDPGIDGSELSQLADDLGRLGVPVVAGFCTHPHWDHLLWHPRFGDVPRYATVAGARAAFEAREQAQAMAAHSASGIPLELIGLVSPLPADGGPLPGEIVEHSARRPQHGTRVALVALPVTSGPSFDHVVDGDTLDVGLGRLDGRFARVRTVQIDAPESSSTRYGHPDRCGPAAKRYAER